MNKISVTIIICIMFTVACSKTETDKIDFGDIKNSVYQNSYFGLSVKIPAGWSIQPKKFAQKF